MRFVCKIHGHENDVYACPGCKLKHPTEPNDSISYLTKREYFAGLAMQNLQNVLLRKSGAPSLAQYGSILETVDEWQTISRLAVMHADALIMELNHD